MKHRPNTKTQVVQVRLTTKERLHLRLKSQSMGMTVSDFIRYKTGIV
jgi:hypothetical protein